MNITLSKGHKLIHHLYCNLQPVVHLHVLRHSNIATTTTSVVFLYMFPHKIYFIFAPEIRVTMIVMFHELVLTNNNHNFKCFTGQQRPCSNSFSLRIQERYHDAMMGALGE